MKKTAVFILMVIAGMSLAWAQETTEEWTAARMEYAKSKNYNSLIQSSSERKAVMEAFKAEDYEKTINLGLKWLEKNPTDIRGLHVVGVSYDKLGKIEEAKKYLNNRNKICDSIAASGDGRTLETAFLMLSTAEVHDFINILGAQNCKYVLQPGGGDRADCNTPEGREISIYFKYISEYWSGLLR